MQIPLNGRKFLSLAQLSDAVVIPPGGTRGDALQQAGPLPNVGGQRSGHNIYLLDGVKVTDELFNNLVINPSVDSIQEFKIQKSQYPAEFGGKASALINVVTTARAPTTFDGSVFEFARDDALRRAQLLRRPDQAVPPLRQQQFGGVARRSARDETVRSSSAATKDSALAAGADADVFGAVAAARGGDFSGLAPICDPLTINPSTGAARRLRATASRPTASIRSPRHSCSTCRCRRQPRRSRT